MKLFILVFICVIPFYVAGQEKVSKDSVHTYVEKMPEFPGGNAGLTKFLQKNLRYPPEAREKGVEGRVVTQFVVDEDGTITDVQILRGIGGGCDEEVIRVLKMMPRWIPGTQNNLPVKVFFKMPVTFALGEEDDKNEGVHFAGNEKEYQKFLRKNLKYPKDARKNRIEGVVSLSFHVDKYGKATDVKVQKSLSPSCDAEALRLFHLISDWIPASKNGEQIDADGEMVVEFRR
ncbi:MAG TPA: energy transducer TonB [Chitinophagales bacterium]|nr:energy transducer TonB [Chitinophagales bacterium]